MKKKRFFYRKLSILMKNSISTVCILGAKSHLKITTLSIMSKVTYSPIAFMSIMNFLVFFSWYSDFWFSIHFEWKQ